MPLPCGHVDPVEAAQHRAWLAWTRAVRTGHHSQPVPPSEAPDRARTARTRWRTGQAQLAGRPRNPDGTLTCRKCRRDALI